VVRWAVARLQTGAAGAAQHLIGGGVHTMPFDVSSWPNPARGQRERTRTTVIDLPPPNVVSRCGRSSWPSDYGRGERGERGNTGHRGSGPIGSWGCAPRGR